MGSSPIAGTMKLNELMQRLKNLQEVHGDSLVMCLDSQNVIHSLNKIEGEVHAEADGSSTIWIKLEEY